MPFDRALHDELVALGAAPSSDDRAPARLWAVLDDYECWPGRSLVGDDGAEAAWLIAQRAVFDPGLQRRCLDLLELAVDLGEAPAVHHALLEDRVRMADGLDQRYGSQLVLGDDGEPQPWPIEDAEHVDERRARVGLGPLADHVATMRDLAHTREAGGHTQ